MLDGLVEVILDPELGGGSFQGGHMLESVDEHGRAGFTERPFGFAGNIQPAPGRERELLPEGERAKAAILIFSDAPLTAGDAEAGSDRVYYQGAVYRVRLAESWREQAGFTKALAVLELEDEGAQEARPALSRAEGDGCESGFTPGEATSPIASVRTGCVDRA